jgi:hypothetical protein
MFRRLRPRGSVSTTGAKAPMPASANSEATTRVMAFLKGLAGGLGGFLGGGLRPCNSAVASLASTFLASLISAP